MSELTRRNFLKGSAGLAGVAAGVALLPDPRRAYGQEIQKEKWNLHWDGEWKRVNSFPGTKFVPITGLGESWQNTTFQPVIESVIYPLGFDQHDIVPPSFRINTSNPLLGEPYDSKDAVQHPEVIIYNVHKQVEKHKQNYPQDKLWLIGYSMGGYIAYRIATMHPDVVEGVITLNGAIKGADIVPSTVDVALAPIVAPIIGGEAGKHLLERAVDPSVSQKVERDILRLRMGGMTFLTCASTTDRVVPAQYATAYHADKFVNERRVNVSFPMDDWTTSEMYDHVINQLSHLDAVLPPDTELRQVKQRIEQSFLHHRAVTMNPLLFAEVQYVLAHRVSSLRDTQIHMRKGEQYLREVMKIIEALVLVEEKALSNMIRSALPYRGQHFTLSSDHLTIDMNITSKDDDGLYEELDRFLEINSVDAQSRAWRRLLRVRQS